MYSGAFTAYLGDAVPQIYNNSMRVTEPSRFFVLDAWVFAELMHYWFPMAVHLLEGLFFGQKNTQEAIGQRERLLALGSLSAGLTHELNNPAAAAVRATASLRERVAGMRHKLGMVASWAIGPGQAGGADPAAGRGGRAGAEGARRWRRSRPRTGRTPSATGSRITACGTAGTWRRRSSRPGSTWPGSITSR